MLFTEFEMKAVFDGVDDDGEVLAIDNWYRLLYATIYSILLLNGLNNALNVVSTTTYSKFFIRKRYGSLLSFCFDLIATKNLNN